MRAVFAATTFPTPLPPHPPLPVWQSAVDFWFAMPVVLVLALIWAVFRWRVSWWLNGLFQFVVVMSVVVFAGAAVLLLTRSDSGARLLFDWPQQPVSGIRPFVSVQSGGLYMGIITAPEDAGYTGRRRFGFGYMLGTAMTETTGSGGLIEVGTIRQLIVPLWAVMVLSGLSPAAWVVRRVLARRGVKQALCPTCGYDLRATPERCPECGMAPAN